MIPSQTEDLIKLARIPIRGAQGWQPLGEVPPVNETVLLHIVSNEYEIGYYDTDANRGNFYIQSSDSIVPDEYIIRWMQIPE